MNADQVLTQGANRKSIGECLAWREITVANPAFMLRRLSDCGMAGEKDRSHSSPRDGTENSDSQDRPAFVEGGSSETNVPHHKRTKSGK
jgi:hypothetical protein